MQVLKVDSSPPRPSRKILLREVIGFLIFLAGAWILHEIHVNRYSYFIVTSESMEPAIKTGDRLIMIRPASYHRGDVVVFPDIEDAQRILVKRLVAMGPDRVEVRKGQLFLNGLQSDPPQGATPPTNMPDRSWTLRPDEVFVAGDNRPASKDSRDYGPLPIQHLRGTVRFRLESWMNWKTLQ